MCHDLINLWEYFLACFDMYKTIYTLQGYWKIIIYRETMTCPGYKPKNIKAKQANIRAYLHARKKILAYGYFNNVTILCYNEFSLILQSKCSHLCVLYMSMNHNFVLQ